MVLTHDLPRWYRLLAATLLVSATLTSTPLLAERIYELKFATLAPAGTTWVKLLQDFRLITLNATGVDLE